MNKKITHILSLTTLLLIAVSFAFLNKERASAEDEKINDTDVFSKELASLKTNDSAEFSRIENIELNDIQSLNNRLLALEDDVEVINENATTSYYHEKFVGKKTANGEVFNNKKYTAAHKTLPFGSKLRVTNNQNDESVIVTVNDRGPFSKGRQLDLSKQAFLDITHNKSAGILNVKIEVLPDDYEDTKIEIEENLGEFLL